MTALNKLKEICDRATFVQLSSIPGYKIGSDGTVISFSSNWRGHGEREIVPILNKYGYLKVRLVIDGKRKGYYVHKLVAEAFLPSRPLQNCQLRHLNGIRTDNRVENLTWGTAKENAADRELHGNTARGSRNGFAQLTEAQVKIIKESSMSNRKLAILCGVSSTTVNYIKSGRTWTHVKPCIAAVDSARAKLEEAVK